MKSNRVQGRPTFGGCEGHAGVREGGQDGGVDRQSRRRVV